MSVFENELEELRGNILKLGYMVENAIRDSVSSLVERDTKLAEEVIKRDHLINALDVKIDEECVRLIALRQPMARDLRLITTAMKITTDLERMGDLAVNIAERAIELNQEPQLKPFVNIPKMAKIAQSMVRDALDSFVTGCSRLPYEVIKRDDEVDDLTVKNFEELLAFMIKDPKNIPLAIKRTYVAKYLERIADHATNICEMIIYMCKGKMIRHTEIT
ncbi:MAG: phosphate signaling complex protein PhoU [Nitrospirae bacterium]|jgi:phosphate transport system protein|nr:phosphate signaling complex protein PhoU [Nitrospirota bacterium]